MNIIAMSQVMKKEGITETSGLIKNLFATPAIDYLVFIFLLLVANVHLLTGEFDTSFIFLPEPLKAGEWWRLITFPFVHITWYHLVLDAGAFLMLYKDIQHEKVLVRLFYLIMCGAVSLCAAVIASPAVSSLGLCGLSGIAHGLMAVSGLYIMERREQYRLGIVFFLLVVCKSIYETIAGDVLFSFMHLGMCGTPLAACHAGGVLGGIIAFNLHNLSKLER